MSESKLYYIYLDTKIIGAIEQLVGYFQAHIFNQNDCINVVCKYYKEIDASFSKIFKKNKIPFIFIKKQSDLRLEKKKVVFYLFNAQSNCRLVANRELTHIFVTHGESHKLASIKPIIRIYDYIVTSGVMGIERYLKAGIFTPYDVETGKIITLGDTFLGSNDFVYNENSRSIVYAPTWEGGVPEENYCSLSIKNTNRIIDFCNRYKIDTIYIKPHPNLGHRDSFFKEELKKCIDMLQQSRLKIVINKNKSNPSWHKYFTSLDEKDSYLKKIGVKYAITDISAMEMQFINKRIPCVVLIDTDYTSNLLIPKKLDAFYSHAFISNDDIIDFHPTYEPIRNKLINYFFSYPSNEVAHTCFRKRIEWLCGYTNNHLQENRANLKIKY
ncbi:hypothetical protein [Rahnella woolbedingensis]|uniref:Uncharacterized protein n=1 Tax=Rahnella woolbedingensis TaxID=1510574 RepID=A0A419NDR5_9GAMM|nr:hypothetical protein [Rahnella woolbedingensis]RJT46761.1 hypothetical protein D6C13_02935 [Rahnella woolbedingensis]